MIGVTAGPCGWTYFHNLKIKLEWFEYLGQSLIWRSLSGELCLHNMIWSIPGASWPEFQKGQTCLGALFGGGSGHKKLQIDEESQWRVYYQRGQTPLLFIKCTFSSYVFFYCYVRLKFNIFCNAFWVRFFFKVLSFSQMKESIKNIKNHQG